MDKHQTISSGKPDQKCMDFEFLRAEGLKHIEALGKKIWTDYNVHDPGITILEVLCYAITDLGYRTSFDIKDLLAEPDDITHPPQFFTAKDALTCNPVTELDFRKLMIDTDKVKNAWIYVADSSAPPIYVNCEDSQLEVSGADEDILKLGGLYNILLELDDDVDLGDAPMVDSIKKKVEKKLHNARNLGEDFLAIDVVGVERIGLCADIEVTGDAEIEEVLAEIYFKIHQFISPNVRFYTLAEMLDKGKKSEEIFDGPFLKNGFIDTEELAATVLPKELHLSDLFRVIMGVAGVQSIRKLFVSGHDSGGPPKSEEWCLPLHPPLLKARLSTELSMVTFYKGLVPLQADEVRVMKKLALKLAMATTPPIDGDGNDFEIPKGTHHDLKDYTSIQEEFPLTYGIGSEGLPDTVADLRKAQAKQLKGYLTLFDQLLANYLVQLSRVKDLLAVHQTNDRTYFAQALYDVPGINELLVGYTGSGPADWDNFKADSANFHIARLTNLLEDDHTRRDRRNRILDHLMARFGERFNDYAMLMYDIYGNTVNENLIDDKEAFLKDYPVVSRDRGKAFNYKAWDAVSSQPDAWDTFNVSGLEARIARVLGVDNYRRRHLYCQPVYNLQAAEITSGPHTGEYMIYFRDADNNLILTGSTAHVTLVDAEDDEALLRIQLLKKERYQVESVGGDKYQVFVNKDDGTHLAESTALLDSEWEGAVLTERILKLVCPETDCGEEGFHLVEHILLRPAPDNPGYNLLPINVKCGDCVESFDPYSFRLSLVVPYWPKRFREWTFREFFEKTVRQETPAHIAVKVCWVSCLQMRLFEEAYKNWLEEKARQVPNKDDLKQYTNALIDILFKLRNVHRLARLHDCETSEEALVLGHSNLGQF